MSQIGDLLRALYRNLFLESTVYEDEHGPDRRRRVLNTILLLLLFRILADIPALNVDEERLHQLLADNPFLGFVDLLAGGDVLKHFSVVAAGIFPYLVALAIAQGATLVVPSLREMRNQGEELKKRVKLIAKVLTVILAFLLALFVSHVLSRQTGFFPGKIRWFTGSTFLSTLWIVVLVTFGSTLSAGLVNWISRTGIRPGENIVLLAGASLTLAKQIADIVRDAPDTASAMERVVTVSAVLVVLVALAFVLVSAQRPVRFTFPRRQTNLAAGGSLPSASVPLLLNGGGIVPLSAAIGLLGLLRFADAYIASGFGGSLGAAATAIGARLALTSGWYWVALAALIVLFTYACNFATIDAGLADNMKKQGAFIPGLRPGTETATFISKTVARISLLGGVSMALFGAGVPYVIFRLTQRDDLLTVLSLIIIVKTVVAVWSRYQADGTMERYDTLLKRVRV